MANSFIFLARTNYFFLIWISKSGWTDKKGNEITLIDILGFEAGDVIKEVDFRIEKKIHRNLDTLDVREK